MGPRFRGDDRMRDCDEHLALRRLEAGSRALQGRKLAAHSERFSARGRLRPGGERLAVFAGAARAVPRLFLRPQRRPVGHRVRRHRDQALQAQQHRFLLDRRQQGRRQLYRRRQRRAVAVRAIQHVIAVQINTVPQVFDLTSASAFADLGGSPPQARYVAVVNRFVVLSGMGTSTPYRIQWSGLNAVTTWTSGVNSSDFQDLPDGGVVRAIGGGETGLITQDGSLRRMIFAPGAPYVFQIERVAQDKGIFAPLSLVRAGDRLFFCGNDGFYMILPGGYPVPIGKERFDRTFFGDVDTGQLHLIIG